jgi:hypothetical protein
VTRFGHVASREGSSVSSFPLYVQEISQSMGQFEPLLDTNHEETLTDIDLLVLGAEINLVRERLNPE